MNSALGTLFVIGVVILIVIVAVLVTQKEQSRPDDTD